MPGALGEDPKDVLSRMVLLTQLPSTSTPEIIQAALRQFGTVKRVVIRRDPLCPSSNLFLHSGCSALVEMGSEQLAKKLLAEADEKLFIIGTGPRAVQADPVELAMVDQADWPALFPQPLSDRIGTRTDLAEASGRGLMEGAGTDLAGRPNPDSSQARPRRLRLVDASKGGPEAAEAMGLTSRMGTGRDVAEGSGRDPNGMERESDELGRNLAELREQIEDPEKQKQLHRLAVAHAMQLRILEERTIQEHLEMHEKQRKLLEGELRKVVESQEYVERDNGAVAMLKHYYWPHGMGVEYPP